MRPDGRKPNELRPVSMEVGFAKFAEGSCLIKMGDTHVLATATVEDQIPRWMKGTGEGWITAEYAMLPRSGRQRNQRDSGRGPNGRSMEIQRLIGRALRLCVDLKDLGERTIIVDCDAIRADGGTRCASITAGYVAVAQAIDHMMRNRMLKREPIMEQIAAVSVGVYRNEICLDLDYAEDSQAQTDMNVVMAGGSSFVEVQGTAESAPFTVTEMSGMVALAREGILQLMELQNQAIASFKN